MTFKLSPILVALAIASPALAQQEVLRGPGGSDIYQVDANVIEVVSNMNEPRGWWCGAVHYARHHSTPWSDHIVVVSAPADTSFAESGQGVKFTLNASAAGVSEGAQSDALEPGNWQTVTEANRGCINIDNPRDN
ncbi:hypothetical protein [Marinibacterium profundimaris]|uniref:Uncharacterized protein n=1 Tax=Marinibacterium profundimaris TaxID=1679460 RepID=A0A225NCE9_9RHOB|nr:hypothetical protein [Marinibacterium profundimaris]OWU69035.1 hypothetical protein ATO3_23355 [Marinibacterium profundimaris]